MSRRMEIVVAESSYGRSRNSSRPLSRARTVGYVAEPFDSEKLPATLISDIRQFLRVANEIENESPRVAYLCRFHAFEKAHTLDPNSSGRGVRQFKIALLQWLERDGEATILMRKEMSDTRELKQLYLKYKDYIRRQNIQDPADREKVVTAHVIASVLFEVLKTFTSEAAQEILAAGDDIYVPYNILPLDPSGAQQAIMQLPEIKAAVAAVQNIRGLPLSENHHKSGNVLDLLDWLQHWFGFQKGNVANQREHLILLLANMHIRQTPKPESISKLDERAVDQLMKKLFKNYMNWCKFLGRKSNVWLPTVHQEVQQHKILYMSLYLLIWGEASNLRLMPECLCYIYHNMSYELYGVLSRADSLVTGEKVVPVYGGESESFLNNVVTPIYKVIYEEAQKNKGGTVDHSNWRNYDDLNEYFWSPDCFQLGWPMRLDSSFFHTFSSSDDCHTVSKLDRERFPKLSYQDVAQRVTCLIDEKMKAIKDVGLKWLDKKKFVDIHSIWHLFVSAVQTKESEGEGEKWLGKTNFVEIRSFWHLFRSFDRMWTCFILALQVMIILSWHGLRSPIELFDAAVLEDIMTIFITSAVLNFIQAILDIVITWKARQAMNLFQTLRYVLKVVVAAMWAIILPVNYARSGNNSYCSGEPYRSWVGEWMCFSPYIITLAIYLVTNAIGMVLLFVPALSSYIETSNWRVLTILSWWSQPRLYVGRGMQESQISLFKYTIFWVILLISKFSFSYYFEIKPLVEPTKQIMQIGVNNYEWHELFPRVKRNASAVLAIWAPVILVYFMDTQIWYAIFCMIFGGVCGLFHRLGEIRTMGMLRTRFQSLPAAFNVHLFPSPPNERKRNMASFFGQKFCKVSENEIDVIMRFAEVWNQIISSFRLEDLISNREMDLMIVPSSSKLASAPVHWPVFLLATKFSTALNMAKDFDGTDQDLYRKIRKDNYMYCAVKECYESLKYILDFLVIGDLDKRVVSGIISEVETSINRSTLLVDFKMSKLPALYDKFIQLVNLLVENEQYSRDKIAILIQDMFEVVTKDMMVHRSSILDSIYCSEQLEEDTSFLFGQPEVQTFASKSAIYFPLPDTSFLKEQIKRLLLLLTAKESAMDIPMNLEARRRISFFATSLFMDMPNAPKVRNMLAFSVMTPYYTEEVNFSKEELHSEQELDGVSIIFYMQTIYPDEWKNFLERMECENEEEFNISGKISGKMEELRDWASSRGQTLSRTVRGMMYYRKALKLQAFLDMANNHEILKGYDAIVRECDTNTSQRSLLAHIEALADMKFTYVISCQTFGPQKSSEDPRARDILDLMIKHPSLRVAYIEEKEEIETNKPQKVYYSVLVKAVNKFDQEIYRIKLPGPPIIGEGKPENQNHAIIFTRGEALQTIDMNQDNYMEEALKMRNILQEFLKHQGERRPTVLGLREHIFTGSISSLAGFMSYQETSFVTIGQRVLADPLRVRFHYGHPDLFDRVFHITRGGISKASKTINLSEDVFAGFNSTLRRGNVTYQEYMQVGKGRDVGFNQISKFEAKVANGNSEQTLSRDIYRLGHRFDFFRMLSCYFTTVGFYFNILITVIGAYIFLYGQLYLVLSGMEKAILVKAGTRNIESLETALASQSFIQLGLLTGLPMLMEIGLEKGFRAALSEFVVMQLQLASVFFTFSLGTKSHYYGRTLLHGGAKYRPSGRKFVVFFHASFTENYRLYSRSHFVKGFELMLLLIVYNLFRQSYLNSMTYMIVTYSIWFMAGTWLFAPFLFNPLGFLWPKVVDDWTEWNRWIKNRVGIGVHQDKSWEAWWNEEQVHLKNSGWGARIFEILLSLRFFVYQYGLVYHLDISQANKNISVYLLSWLVIATIFLVVKVVKHGQQWLSTEFQLLFRLFKVLLFLGSLSIIIALSITCKLSIMDLFTCFLAFLPTGWGLLLIAQAVRPLIKDWGIWDSVQVLTQAYDYGMGLLLFVPVAALAWLPFISSFHNRFLFNQAFSRRLQIKKILLARNKRK